MLVEEEVLIVDRGSIKIQGIQWKGGYIDGRGWWVMEEELWTAIVHWNGSRLEVHATWWDRVKFIAYESRIP